MSKQQDHIHIFYTEATKLWSLWDCKKVVFTGDTFLECQDELRRLIKEYKI